MIEYRTRPPAECRSCREPMRRQRWAVTGGLCGKCSPPAAAMATADRVRRLRSVSTGPTSADERIERLARRRAERAAAGGT